MQDIIFYAAMDGTVGRVRDQANAKKKLAPILTRGPEVCLRMRLFETVNTAAPYPIESFNLITDWQWFMDSDFDQSTACKLVADQGGISVQTVTETVNGKSVNFTEFVIPISNMNTEELGAWLGNAKIKPGLIGELVGYDDEGHAAFVLQIEDFRVRNRISSPGVPTALDQEIVTRTQAESMIRTAVSASADTKQDKLTSANAGTGISISSGGTISTANIPQSAVAGLSEALAAKQNAITAGDLVEITGSTVNRKRCMNILSDNSIPTRTISIPGGTATTTAYVLEPGNAYKIHVASVNKWLATTAAFKASSGTWGIEGHIELFVAGTGYVRTDSNVVLANALEPDSVNNCTVRFHDGLAIISVEDHVAGYIVASAAGSTAGTLPYALATTSQEYIAVDAALNGVPLDMGGAVTNGEKHVVGNGYNDTILTSGVSCTGKTTFSNLSMNGVSVLGGTMTLGDVYIPNGATVSVSGGALAVEKVSGNGGVIDLGGTNVSVSSDTTASASGCTFTNGAAAQGGAFFNRGILNATGCVFSGNVASTGAGGAVRNRASASFSSCIITGNTAVYGAFYVDGGQTSLTDCVVSGNTRLGSTSSYDIALDSSGVLTLKGSNTLGLVQKITTGSLGSVVISSGAIVDLTGNTNVTPINPGGGVTFAPGGAAVYPSAGSASAYSLGGMTVPQIGNTNVVNLNGSNVAISSGTTASASGCTFSGGYSNVCGGVCDLQNAQRFIASDCIITGNTARYAGALYAKNSGATIELTNCIVSGNVASTGPDMLVEANAHAGIRGGIIDSMTIGTSASVDFGGSVTLGNVNHIDSGGTVTIASGTVVNLASSIVPGGGITLYGGSLNSETKIVYGSGSSVGSRTFDGLEVYGTTITNQGIISGATVYSDENSWIHYVLYTTDDGATSSSVMLSGDAEYVVPGGLVGILSD